MNTLQKAAVFPRSMALLDFFDFKKLPLCCADAFCLGADARTQS